LNPGIIKRNHHNYALKEYWFWRDSNGHEIDLLTKKGTRFDIYEVKSGSTVLPRFFKGMDYFADLTQGRVHSRTLIYGGDENQNRTNYKVRVWNEV
jgi:predicted AAA+ superfamily ATPase